MIHAGGHAAAVAGEGFFPQKFPAAHFAETVGEPAARQAEAHVGVRSEGASDAQFGIEIDRRDGDAQGEVGLLEPRLVVVEKGVAGGRSAALDVFVVAQLQETPRLGIDLGARGRDDREEHQEENGRTRGGDMFHRSGYRLKTSVGARAKPRSVP